MDKIFYPADNETVENIKKHVTGENQDEQSQKTELTNSENTNKMLDVFSDSERVIEPEEIDEETEFLEEEESYTLEDIEDEETAAYLNSLFNSNKTEEQEKSADIPWDVYNEHRTLFETVPMTPTEQELAEELKRELNMLDLQQSIEDQLSFDSELNIDDLLRIRGKKLDYVNPDELIVEENTSIKWLEEGELGLEAIERNAELKRQLPDWDNEAKILKDLDMKDIDGRRIFAVKDKYEIFYKDLRDVMYRYFIPELGVTTITSNIEMEEIRVVTEQQLKILSDIIYKIEMLKSIEDKFMCELLGYNDPTVYQNDLFFDKSKQYNQEESEYNNPEEVKQLLKDIEKEYFSLINKKYSISESQRVKQGELLEGLCEIMLIAYKAMNKSNNKEITDKLNLLTIKVENLIHSIKE